MRVNTNILNMEETHLMLAKNKFCKKDYPPFDNYEDFLKAVQELDEHEYMLDIHVDNLLIFHQRKRQYFACHNYTKEGKLMLQDKASFQSLFSSL